MKHSDLTKKDVAKEGKMPQAAIDALAKKNGKSTKKDSKKDVQTEDLAIYGSSSIPSLLIPGSCHHLSAKLKL